jgi:hypothetical protein
MKLRYPNKRVLIRKKLGPDDDINRDIRGAIACK